MPTLYSIAAATLGNGSLFMEIFNLNKGRLQPNGQRLEDPHSVEAGWILLLPPDASGPGVHFGPLPTAAKATAQVVHRHPHRSQATAAARAAAAGAGYGSGTLVETVIGGALLVFAAAGLGLVVRRRRRPGGGTRSGSGRRAGSRSRRPGPRSPEPAEAIPDDPGGDWIRSLATDTPGSAVGPGGAAPGGGGPGQPYADHSGWPASDPGRPVAATDGYGRSAAEYGRSAAGDSQDWAYPDHPSWPANSPGGVLTPDHPSWPASDLGPPIGAAADYGRAGGPDRPGWAYPDHPSWPASDVGRPLTDDDYPSWPASDPGGGWAGPGGPAARPGGPPPGGGAGLPQRERLSAAAAPTVHHDPAPRQPVPQVPPARGRHVRAPVGYAGRPGPGGPADDAQQRWSAQLARTTGPIPQTYYDLAFGDGRFQVVLTEPPGANQGWGEPAATSVLQLTGPDTGQQGAVAWQSADPGNADSVRLAQRILADADEQAAGIRLEAAAHAAAIREAAEREAVQIREQTAAEAAPIREGAEREAAEIRELAAAQAVAIRETAEQEVAELRTRLQAMSAELARVAASVTEDLPSPPGTKPGVKPPAKPAGAPGAEPGSGPAAQPVDRPAAAPGTRPRPARPAGPARQTETPARPRQYRTLRVYAATIAVLVVLALGTGAYQLATRGYTFFVFRSAGTGATDNNAIFPGIIPTPKPSPAHHQPTTGPGQHGARKAHHHHHHPRGSRTK